MIDIQSTGADRIVLAVTVSRIDAAGAMTFKDAARQILRDEARTVVLDMQMVEFLDSSGLGSLVAVMKMLGGARRLELLNCGTAVRKVLTLTRMDSVFIVHPPAASVDADGQDAA